MTTFYQSSTYLDLRDYRQRSSAALRKMEHTVVGMENYTISEAALLDKCLKDVARCDAFLGINAQVNDD
jgi:hypothetical protein